MKMKWMSLLAATLLLIALLCCGCGEETVPATAQEVFRTAMEKVADECEIKATVGVTMQYSGVTIDMPMEMTVKAAKKDDTTVMQADVSVSMMDQKIDMSMYMENDTVYITAAADGMTVQYQMPAEENLIPNVEIFADLYDENGLKISDEDLTMTEEEDGTKSLTIKMPTEALGSLMNSAMSTTGASSATEATFKECIATAKVNKDGYITNVTMKLEGTVSDDATGEITFTIDYDIEYLNLGKPVTVTPPDGYLDFPTQEELGMAL